MQFSSYPYLNQSKFLDVKVGSSAEINLLMCGLCKNAGLNAKPALVSTRRHGKVSKDVPFISQFDQVLCYVEISGKGILIDNTDIFRPIDLLDLEDLNHFAFLVSEQNPLWLDVKVPKNSTIQQNLEIDLSQPDIIKYQFQINTTGYDALNNRKEWFADSVRFLANIIADIPENLQIDSFKIENLYQTDKTFILKCYAHSIGNEFLTGEIIYYNPFIFKQFKNNPFKENIRELPVEFPYPIDYLANIKLILPKNYQLDQKPIFSNEKFVDNTGNLIYNCFQADNYIKIEAKLKISELIYFTDEYPKVRNFFSKMSQYFSSVLPIKKTS